MSEALAWLERAAAHAPEHLRERMRAAVVAAHGTTIHDTFADAAFARLRASLQQPEHPDSALDLLTADALLTHACAVAAEAGPSVLERFTARLDAHRFNQLLDPSS